MAILSDGDRADASRKYIQRWFVDQAQTADLTTSEIRTMVNDLDGWLDGNQTSANNAITASVRNKASSAQKFAALAYVALKRSGLLVS